MDSSSDSQSHLRRSDQPDNVRYLNRDDAPERRHPLVVEIDRLRAELDEANCSSTRFEIASQHTYEVGIAVGIVMTTFRLPLHEAREWLLEAAHNTHRDLHAVAANVVHDGLLAPHF